ncbi:helix-turn-helix domain-containing protein [Rhizobium sp. SYY.PMSO]|uniref:helix-turn-helix domain-containing protein n=1 Tax=Rhizobium sp. SYY.PMSO TaxID=3382192 RepID=UPI000DE09873
MSFRFEIGPRARAASRVTANVRSDLVAAILERRSEKGFSQQRLAEMVGVSRGDLNRYLCGRRELPLRSIADLAWALDKEIHIELRDLTGSKNGKHLPEFETRATVHPVCSGGIISWSSSRAIRTIVARASTDRDD